MGKTTGNSKRSLRFFLTLLAGLACLPFASNAANASSAFRAVTYNIWGLTVPFLTQPSRITDIARLLPSLNADVVALEETFTKKAKILTQIHEYPYQAWGPSKSGLIQNSGLLLLSKWPIVETATRRYSRCAGNDCLSHKGILYARIRVDGIGDINIFSTHQNSAGCDTLRELQVAELAQFVREHQGSFPSLILGDFNVAPTSRPYEDMKTLLQVRDTHEEFVGANPGLSETARNGFSFDRLRNTHVSKKEPPRRIDYIWAADSSTQHIDVTKSELVFDAPVYGRFLSDHFGVQADLEFE